MKTFMMKVMVAVCGVIAGIMIFMLEVVMLMNITSHVNFSIVRMTNVRHTDEGIECYELEYDTDLRHVIAYDEFDDLLFNDYVKVKSVTIE